MGFVIKILVTALAVYIADYLLSGVHINDDLWTTIVVALVLAFLNAVVRPILIILTLPVTLLTLGLFLLIINALMVKWAAGLIEGFEVDNWWSAILFSLIVSLISAIANRFGDKKKKSRGKWMERRHPDF